MPFWSAWARRKFKGGFAIGLGVREIGLSGSAAPLQRSSPTGSYVMAAVEHREPCESRGSCTVLGARGSAILPRDSRQQRHFEGELVTSALPSTPDGLLSRNKWRLGPEAEELSANFRACR